MNYKKKPLLAILGLLFLVSGTVIPLFPAHASAVPTTGEWASQTQISYNGEVYTDTKIDGTWQFYAKADSSGSACNDVIKNFKGPNGKNTETSPTGGTIESNPVHAYYYNRTKDPATGACKDGAGTYISLSNVAAAHADFVWQDATSITGVSGGTYIKNADDGLFYEQGGDKCKDTLQITSTGSATIPGSAKLIVRTGGTNTSFDSSNLWVNQYLANDGSKQVDGCTVYNPITVAVSDFNNAAAKTGGSSGVGQTGTGSGGAGSTPTCESSGFTLAWIMCPMINGLSDAVDGIYGVFIRPLLVTKPIDVSGKSCDASGTNPYSGCDYAIWSNFRVYGDIFLVIALLVVVFGQSIGGGLVDAYTAKKVLPRLLIAAILINLSIYIVAIAVDLTNILGNGIQALITQPFKDAGAFHLSLNGGAAATVGAGIAVPLLGTAGTIWAAIAAPAAALAVGAEILPALIGFVALFILLPALMIFLAVLATVLIRRGLIIFLVLVSPVAFALYCLPNTEQYFKKWWDLLIKTLLVYPIIATVFAISDILAVTIQKGGTSSGMAEWVAQLLSIAALIIPLFLIPFSFRLAGGAIGKMHETLTNYHKRAQEAVKGNVNDPRSLRNRTRRNMRSAYNDTRNVGYSALAGKSMAGKDGGRGVRRRIYGGLARGLNYGNLQAERAAMNEETEKMVSSQYSMGDDSNIRAFWAEKFNGDENDGTGRRKGAMYSPYQSADGTYKEWSQPDVDKARALVRRNPSAFQAFAKYEAGKVANTGQQEEFKRRFVESANEFGWSDGQANGVWSGIKFAHQATRKEEKYQGLSGERGKLAWGNTDHAGLSNELTDAVRSGEFASFRETTPMVAAEGLRSARERIRGTNGFSYDSEEARKNKWTLASDQQIERNYENLGEHLAPALFGMGAANERNRQRMEEAAAAGEAGAADQVGFGIGASQRATEKWKAFVNESRTGSTQPGRNRPPSQTNPPPNGPAPTPVTPSNPPAGSGPGGIIVPGDSNFNVPPGSRPGGPGAS